MTKADTVTSADEDVADFLASGKGTEVAKTDRTVTLKVGDTVREMSVNDLRELSFDGLVTEMGGLFTLPSEAIGTDQFGPVLEDKQQLCGKPFMLVSWAFYDGDFGKFVSMWILDMDNNRYIVNDGSTGIFAQLSTLTDETGQTGMLLCKHGLRVSTYDYDLPNGKTVKDAQTFYIDTKL